MQPAIRATHLWKRYRLGSPAHHDQSIRRLIASSPRLILKGLKDGIRRSDPERDMFWALQDVSFDVFPGEVVGIIGRNGAGKSTLFRVLSRITAPTRGRIEIHGTLSSLLEVGTGFHPYLTGRENIFLAGSIFGMKVRDVRKRFDAIVAFSEAERFLDTPVKFFSSGMYVRLAFAVAAHLNPDILIVDEVLAVGDSAFQKKCLDTIREGTKEGRAILFVSHSMQVVRQICTRVIHIEGGKIVSQRDTELGITEYNRFLQQKRDFSSDGTENRRRRSTEAARIGTFSAIRDNEENWRFRHGETVNFSFTYEVKREVPNLAVYLAIRSVSSGETISTTLESISPKSLGAGYRGVAEVRFPNIALRPGDYSLMVQLTDLDRGQIFDVIDENVSLPWLSIEYSPDHPIASEGIVSLPSEVVVRAA